MTTAQDIISLALRDSGVFGAGQVPRAEDSNDALRRLNWMLAQWQRKRWLVYRLNGVSLTSTGAQSYTVGPGEDFDIARPEAIDSAFVRQSHLGGEEVDWTLEEIKSRQDYNRIALKTLISRPHSYFYDPEFPAGRIYFFPVPNAHIYSLHIYTKQVFDKFPNLATEVELPEEYYAAIYYNLMVRLRAAYRLPPDEVAVGLARDALQVVRGANAQIERLRMPHDLGSVKYNVYSDRSN